MNKLLQKFFAAIKKYDDTYNFTCDVCGREVFGNERVCTACMKTLPWNNGAMCPFCGRKTEEPGACLECKERPLVVSKARSAFTHEGEAMKLVLRFKRGAKYLCRALGDALYPVAEREFSEAEALTFVPMTEKAEKKRGYNQSRLLAQELAERLQKPCLAPVIKQRESAAQKTLTRSERQTNLEGCFRVTDRAAVKGKRILIIDDTMTTGATSDELATRLKRAGAREVFLLTVTSVQKRDPFGKKPKIPSKSPKLP